MTFTPIETAAVALAVLLLGYWLRTRVGFLDRMNFPAPVIGGLLAAVTVLAVKLSGLPPIKFDAALQQPMMFAFFTTLGFAASIRLLRKGGLGVILLLVLASVVSLMQSLLGMGVATAFGLHPLTGVLTGTVTLSGGPATGLALAPQFEAAGVAGASVIATATAMAGITLAGLFGAPIATWLIERRKLDPRLNPEQAADVASDSDAASPGAITGVSVAAPTSAALTFGVLKVAAIIVISMWLGGLISAALTNAGIKLPGYIGAMIVAGIIRNVDDATGILKLPLAAIEVAGSVTLALFLVIAMMNLDLTLLAGLALPLIVNLVLQLIMIALLVVGPIWWLMGRNYDSAVTAGGFAGFMLGITANAMAIMGSLVEKYGPAPRAFLTVPLVGAFFIDFTNALILTAALNLG